MGSGNRKINIEKTGAVQTAFRIGSSTINKRHPDYPGLKILNTILGGYFGSRLMKNIREEKGFTYGIHSSVNSLDQAGFKMISTEVGKQYARQAADEIYREILRLQKEPVGPGELEVVRNYMLGEMIRMFDGPFAIAESFKSVWEFGMDFGYFINLMNSVKTISADEIMRLAAVYYKIEDLYEVSAG
jgi:predicted Zn-dependent peptidase